MRNKYSKEIMDENKNLPFEEFAKECDIVNSTNPKNAINQIISLSKRFNEDDLVLIYNNFFETSDNYEILMFLLQKIDKLKNKKSIPVLIDTLIMKSKLSQRIKDIDSVTRIRINITKALANTKDSQCVYPLLYCLNSKDENYKIKLSCAEALGKIGDKYAVLPLMNIVEDEEESSVYVKESAVSALGMIGDSKAVDSLLSILESKKGFLDKFTFLKERALEALNKLSFKGDRAFNALVKALRDESPRVRINAIEVLMNSDYENSSDLIKEMLYDNSREVVQNAVIALYNLKGYSILDEIINSETSSDYAKEEAINLKQDLKEEEDSDEE